MNVSHERLSEVFFLKDYSSKFEIKYPLICVPDPCENIKQAVCSLSRFPSELKENLLYLGNLTNVMNKDFA